MLLVGSTNCLIDRNCRQVDVVLDLTLLGGVKLKWCAGYYREATPSLPPVSTTKIRRTAKTKNIDAIYQPSFFNYLYSSMSFKEGSKFPAGVEFSYIPIQLDDLELINPLKCDVASQLKLDNLLTKLSTTDTPNLLIVSVPGAFTPTCTESHLPLI